MPAEVDELRVLREAFHEEAAEGLTRIGALLLALESGASSGDQVAELLRVAHSLKGAARMVGMPIVGELLHALEGRVSRLRDDPTGLSPGDFEWALAVRDAAAEAIAALPAVNNEPTDTLRALLVGPAGDLASASLASNTVTAPTAPDRVLERRAADDAIAALFAPLSPSPRPLPAAPTALPTSHRKPAESVRISVEKLDRVASQVDELMVARLVSQSLLATLQEMSADLVSLRRSLDRSEDDPSPCLVQPTGAERLSLKLGASSLRDALPALERLAGGLARDTTRLERALTVVGSTLQEDLRRLRQRPFSTILEGLPREVRDLARTLKKEVQLKLTGTEMEVDRIALEALAAPILHLVRNAIDHGLEDPETRESAGKPRRGTVHIDITRAGSHVAVVVRDDGRGLDSARIEEIAIARGLLDAQEIPAMTRAEIVRLLFEPGFSTAREVSEISGRGVGLDAVETAVNSLGGFIEVTDAPQAGTAFEMIVPIALATVMGLLLREGDATYIMPVEGLARVTRVLPAQLLRAGSHLEAHFDGHPVPVLRLSELLGAPSTPMPVTDDWLPVLLTRAGGSRPIAILVDEVLCEQEVVIKPFGVPLQGVVCLAGAAIDAAGRVVPVLEPLDLIRSAERQLQPPTRGSSSVRARQKGRT